MTQWWGTDRFVVDALRSDQRRAGDLVVLLADHAEVQRVVDESGNPA
jgi:hypothetical protein